MGMDMNYVTHEIMNKPLFCERFFSLNFKPFPCIWAFVIRHFIKFNGEINVEEKGRMLTAEKL